MMEAMLSITTCIMVSPPEQVLEIIIMMKAMMMTTSESMTMCIMNDEEYSLKEAALNKINELTTIAYTLFKANEDDKEAAAIKHLNEETIEWLWIISEMISNPNSIFINFLNKC